MSFGIWPALIIVAFLALPIIAIWTERSDRRLKRGQFAKRFFGLWFAVIVLEIVLMTTLDGQDKLVGALLTMGISICAVFPLFRWLVQRARDTGMSKAVVYLAIIPLVNLIILIYLLLKKTARDADQGTDIPSSAESQETRL